MGDTNKRRRRRIPLAVFACLVFVAAAGMTLSTLVVHGSSFPTKYDSVKDYLPSFVSMSSNDGEAAAGMSNNVTMSDDTCFSLNSKSWLQGSRVENAPLESNEVAMNLILNKNFSSLLEQTMCHEKSRFRDWFDISQEDSSSLNLAALRLVYLSFHIHQHEPAWREARHRRQYCTAEDLRRHDISNMSYECPGQKFLVVPLGEAGLGAVMRLTVVNALLAGMATQRVVLFVNNANVGPPNNVRKPWPHASCERHDMQCFFLAPSPCVLTEAELANAHVLERSEMRSMFRHGEISGERAEDRVVVTKINTRPHMAPPHLRENLVAIAKKYILPGSKKNDNVLKRAVELIHEIEPLEESRYYYFGHSSKVHHGAVFYAMRPRPEYAKLLNEIVEQSLPDDFDAATSLGLPIRGSDKCLAESECLSFEQYMNATASLWNQHRLNKNDDAVANIILTTEDESVMNDMHKFESTTRSSFDYFSHRFITNKKDVLQGTGLANDFEKSSRNITADQVMLSSVAALKLQLSAKYTIGNCCSNFHNLLFDFVRDGCGAAPDSTATCLQEMDEPEFRVCCSWDKSDECVAKRQGGSSGETNKTAVVKP